MKHDIIGNALIDYHQGCHTGDIVTYSSLDETDSLPLKYLFRSFADMPALEQRALECCKGKTLDIGCGAGSHAIYLQEKGMDVVGLDESTGAIAVCKQRGLKKAVQGNFMDFEMEKFDTLLLLMNGTGLAGRLDKMDSFFSKLKSLLNSGGQILLDSSDIIYMFESDEDGGYWIPKDVDYYGEVTFTMEYKNQKSEPFPWLYVDYNTLQRTANYNNLNCEIIMEGEHYDYLARLTL